MLPGENRWAKEEEVIQEDSKIENNYSEWEAAIAERADIRYGEQENLERGEGHTTMEGICLYLTTVVGCIFFIS